MKKRLKIFGIFIVCILILLVIVQSFKHHEVQFSVLAEPNGNNNSVVKIFVGDKAILEKEKRDLIFIPKNIDTTLTFGFHNVKVLSDEDILHDATILVSADYKIAIHIRKTDCATGKCVDIYSTPQFIVDNFMIK